MARAARHSLRTGAIALVPLLGVALLAFLALAGFFDAHAERWFGAGHSRPQTVAILFSGDMGMRFGMAPTVAHALARSGLPVMGVSSPRMFASHKSRAEVDALVAGAIAQARRDTGASRVLALGESFGADMLRVALADMSPADRAHLAGAILVVPGADAYFRADPTGFAYRGTPDVSANGTDRLNWLPLGCVRGSRETDSLCPSLHTPNVRQVILPGGHFLNFDSALLNRTVLALASASGVRLHP